MNSNLEKLLTYLCDNAGSSRQAAIDECYRSVLIYRAESFEKAVSVLRQEK